MSEYNTNEVQVGSHQSSSKVGKIKSVKPHSRSDRKEKLVQPRNKEKAKLIKGARRSLINGSQTQITKKGQVKKPDHKDLIDMVKENDNGKSFKTSYEARIISREYKRVLDKIKVIVKKMGGIDKARKSPTYVSLIKQQSRRLKEYRKLVTKVEKNEQNTRKTKNSKKSDD